jgi:hypothetical protein
MLSAVEAITDVTLSERFHCGEQIVFIVQGLTVQTSIEPGSFCESLAYRGLSQKRPTASGKSQNGFGRPKPFRLSLEHSTRQTL